MQRRLNLYKVDFEAEIGYKDLPTKTYRSYYIVAENEEKIQLKLSKIFPSNKIEIKTIKEVADSDVLFLLE